MKLECKEKESLNNMMGGTNKAGWGKKRDPMVSLDI